MNVNHLKNYRISLFLFITLSIVVKCILFTAITAQIPITEPHFYGLMKTTLSRTPYYLGFILLLLCFSFLFTSKKSHFIYLLIADVLVTLLMVADIWYYRGFSTLPSIVILQQFDNLENLSGSIISLMKPIDLLLFGDFILLGFIYKRLTYEKKRVKFFISLLVALVLVFHVPFSSKYLGIRDSKALFSMLDTSITALNLSPIGYHFMDAYYYVKENKKLLLTQNEKDKIEEWFNQSEKTAVMSAPIRDKNIIVLQLESFEDFVIGLKVDNQEVTPNLNKLLANSYRFTNIYEQVKEGTTSDAEFMINTSLYPLQKGSVFFRYPHHEFPSLPDHLEKQGYSTISMHGDRGTYWNWMNAHRSIGFNTMLDSSAWTIDEQMGMGLSDRSFLRQVSEKIVQQPKPFYSFIVTLTSHSPFVIDEKEIRIKIPEKLKGTTIGRYMEATNYTDYSVGEFIKELEKNNLLQDTILVIYGDHEGVHKYYGDEEASKLYKNEKRVPFIIYHPSIEGKEIDTIGGQIDIMPTVLSLVGMEKPIYAKGRDLFTTKQSFAALMNGTIVGNVNEAERARILEGIIHSDLIIRSNYLQAVNHVEKEHEVTREYRNIHTPRENKLEE
ncbi:LTA synthase family protein [Brevibacillus daliensis]|uniref:LTA synthase family protein n=1 Tax=Brevibacillus daliensis TaxID=2892995 RepID=UPI001E3BE643|nr:LTA synthase family protein [Brevibacillus daliensis]